jgi:hypothetical protein
MDLALVEAALSGDEEAFASSHYNRPDVFRLHVDTSTRPPGVVESFPPPPPETAETRP